MSRVYEPGMVLLGFKPISSIKPYFHVKPANFIFPDEKSVQGMFSRVHINNQFRKVCDVAVSYFFLKH